MGKVWGYTPKQEASLYGMFAKQKLGRGKRNRQVIMKLPKTFALQRMILTKHIARLNRFPVYCAKMSDVNFEDKVDAFKKNGVSSLKNLRHCRERNDSEIEGTGNVQLGRFDFDKMKFVSLKRRDNYQKKDFKEKEDLQRSRWRAPLLRDHLSPIMNEVFAMNRMVTQTCHSFSMYQESYTIFLESSHYGLKIHDWPKVALAFSGLLHIAKTRPGFRYPERTYGSVTAMWMHGLLALVNNFKEDTQIVKQYAECLKSMIRSPPKWTGIQVAAWLIQKGYFSEGHAFLTEYSVVPPGSEFARENERNLANLKRHQTNFVSDFISAVKVYSEWRKESALLADNEQSLDDFGPLKNSISRKGETALTAYEVLNEQQKFTKADVMCFLEPFVELLMEYRSPTRALEVLQQIVKDNEGNLIVEQFFVAFLENFADVCGVSEESLALHKERVNRRLPICDEAQQHDLVLQKIRARRRIRCMRETKKKSGTIREFTKIENPGFSG